eukprot:maker-scaffold_5-snap-gene-7.2-mRNA-1 protein AED:0.00 eAED:0.00 QI:65/1/1/1/1/1/2/345/264
MLFRKFTSPTSPRLVRLIYPPVLSNAFFSTTNETQELEKILLFEAQTPRKIRVLSIFTTIQSAYWGYISTEKLIFSVDQLNTQAMDNDIYNFVMHPFWTFSGVGMTGALWTMLYFFSKRTVSSISLIDDSYPKKFEIKTHNLFGLPSRKTEIFEKFDIVFEPFEENKDREVLRFVGKKRSMAYLVGRDGNFFDVKDFNSTDYFSLNSGEDDDVARSQERRKREEEFIEYIGVLQEHVSPSVEDNIKVGEEVEPYLPEPRRKRRN